MQLFVFLFSLLSISFCFQALIIVNKKICKKSNSLFSSLSADDDAISKCGTCKLAPKCSGEYSTKGCDGSGKIQGGIATVPLFSWWPIKVYRPCPSYLAAGYVYRREGQTMDQVLFSEPSTKMREKIEALRQQQQQLEEDQQQVEDRKQIVSKSEDQKELDEAVEAMWNDRKKKQKPPCTPIPILDANTEYLQTADLSRLSYHGRSQNQDSSNLSENFGLECLGNGSNISPFIAVAGHWAYTGNY
eukprot:gene22973-29765_t